MTKAEKLVEKVIKNAPNPDWKRNYEIVRENVVGFNNPHNGKVMTGALIYVKWLSNTKDKFSKFNFTGFVLTSIPDAFYNYTDVILTEDNEVFENKVEKDFLNRVKRVQENLKYKGCPECKTLRDMVVTKRKVCGPECVSLTYTCKECGYKDYDVID